ncbi:MAG: caspase family protein [Myxococcales bacterium]
MRHLPVAVLLLAVASPVAAAEGEGKATFALILGVNQSVDPELPVLRYADDDAARNLDLFRALGARTYLLARLDENTARVHPQALAEAALPRLSEFEKAVADLAADVEKAKGQGLRTEVFFVYAGHGNVNDGKAYLCLEDARLTGKQLSAALLEKVPATRIHLIVDACYSYLLAYGRGPGGQRREIEPGFSRSIALSQDERVGLLLSTSSARESHEWEGFQGGVFSHEVRSGLYGAADADGDGVVGYREIAAFVQRANASIPNERFRPDVWAKAPQGSDELADLRHGLQRRLEIDGSHAARYLLEDQRGVRLADFHNAQGQALKLVRPLSAGALYLRRLSDEKEFAIGGAEEVVALSSIEAAEPRVHGRGAAHDSFQRLFELPFDRAVVAEFSLPPAGVGLALEAPPLLSARKIAAIPAYVVGAAGIVGGIWTFVATQQIRDGSVNDRSQAEVVRRNQRIEQGNVTAVSVLAIGIAAAAAGTALLLLPEDNGPRIVLAPTTQGGYASLSGRF